MALHALAQHPAHGGAVIGVDEQSGAGISRRLRIEQWRDDPAMPAPAFAPSSISRQRPMSGVTTEMPKAPASSMTSGCVLERLVRTTMSIRGSHSSTWTRLVLTAESSVPLHARTALDYLLEPLTDGFRASFREH